MRPTFGARPEDSAAPDCSSCVGQDVEYIEMLVTLSDRLPSSQSMSVEAYWNDELGALIVSHIPGSEPVLLSNAANNQYSHGSEPWIWDARRLVQRDKVQMGPNGQPGPGCRAHQEDPRRAGLIVLLSRLLLICREAPPKR